MPGTKVIQLPYGWERNHPGIVIDTIRSGLKASHERGWDDCNLWVQYDYAITNIKIPDERQKEFESVKEKMEVVRNDLGTDTRKNKLVHCLVANVLQELDP